MTASTAHHPVPRLLQDLAEGRLDESELDALAAWLAAQGPTEPPDDVLARALRAGQQVGAGAA